ncbi:hypothetical protein [Halomonas sp. HG01]|uniref:hypothetical protein n=1 Tax=Halomonas sp. HG01 TaxID=1609967 RepID=UPI000614554D|nr:hypothetical protein [Halomonas sp. HG01]
MKQHKFQKPMDEREKLRKFRELDDAFAEALRELETPGAALDIPAEPSSTDAPHARQVESSESRQQLFERRLRELMQDYSQQEDSVSDLLQTLQSLGRIA